MASGSRHHPSNVRITLLCEHAGASPAMRRWVKAHLRKLALLAGVTQGELNVLIVGDAAMKRWHYRHMKKRSTTDVLSFDLRASPQEPLCADLVVCLDVATRQAQKFGHQIRLELLLYCLHGLLHMLGYDDLSPAEHRRMHQREDQLLQLAGLPAVYASCASHRSHSRIASNKLAKSRP